MTPAELEVRGVGKVFPSPEGDVVALTDVTFSLEASEFVSIVGPSGCGKTTLLKIIADLQTASRGEVNFGRPLAPGSVRAAFVFQDHGLLPWDTVLRNVALGLEFLGVSKAEREGRARRFLEQIGLGQFLNRRPHELSIGMRQRVALARAFVAHAEILLLDEPFGSLDAQTKLILQEELLRIWRDHRRSVIHVTHDIEEAILLSDRVLVMSGRPGTIREQIPIPLGRPREPRDLDRPEISAIRWRIWNALREEVRKSLCMDA